MQRGTRREVFRSTRGQGDLAAQREADAAFFADWSCGRDRYGTWLFADIRYWAIVVRPSTAAMIDLIRPLGTVAIVNQMLGYYEHPKDYVIPPARWRELHALLPQLVRLRRKAILQGRLDQLRFRRQNRALRRLATRPVPTMRYPDAPATDAQLRYLHGLLDRSGSAYPPAGSLSRAAASAAIDLLRQQRL